MDEVEKQEETLQSISFSPDLTFINVGTSEGFRVYSTHPDLPVHNESRRGNFIMPLTKYIEKGSIKFVQNISNLVVYVREDGECPSCQLYIYDDDHNRDASKILFKSEIKAFKLTQTW